MRNSPLPIFALALTLFLLPDVGAWFHHPSPIDSVRGLAWVTKEGFGNHCTVTSINEQEHFWLTASHCITTEQPMFIAGEPADVVMVTPLVEVAILHTHIAHAPALKLASHAPDYGDAVELVGFPLGWFYPLLIHGSISSPAFPQNHHVFAVTQLTVAPGNSGSAVLNANHRIVGLITISFSSAIALSSFVGCFIRVNPPPSVCCTAV